MPLEDYKDIVATTAGISTIGQMFSGVFICRDIVKQGSTKNVSIMPFLGGLGLGVLFLVYSQILNDPAMTRVNWSGIILNIGYLLCYFIYSSEKVEILKQSVYTSCFVGIFILYAKIESPEEVEFRFGVLVTILMFLLIASPLIDLKEIIQTKNTEKLPFPLILSGTIVSFQWLLYGIIIKNEVIQFQNIVGLLLSAVQLSLFAIYPSKPKKEVKAD